MYHKRISVLIIFLIFISPVSLSANEILGLLLTWDDDPTSTIVIDWHTTQGSDISTIEVRRSGSNSWMIHQSESRNFPFSERVINRAKLAGLASDTLYHIRVGCGNEWTFRTMPEKLTRPIKFATGGDIGHGEAFRKTNQIASIYDPDFIIMGGDLAYANGDPRRIENWYNWFEGVMNDLVTAEGRVIPVVFAIGNHEVFSAHRLGQQDADYVKRTYGINTGDAPFYYELFAMPEKRGYNALDFGDYLSLVTLDTNHTTPVVGEQTDWLSKALSDRSSVPYVFPVYHVPAYPSVRRFDGSTSVEVRDNWVPKFEQHKISVAFEHHDHIYKRTFPIMHNKVNDSGVVYIGDGAWGVGLRQIGRNQERPGEKAWYLREAVSVHHFILTTLEVNMSSFLAIDNDGNEIDSFVANPRTPR